MFVNRVVFACYLCIGSVTFVLSSPIASDGGDNSMWKGTPMDAVVRQVRDECQQQSEDSGACTKVKALNLLDQVLSSNSFKVADGVSVVPNENETNGKTRDARSNPDAEFLDHLEDYVKSHDLVVKTPQEGFLRGATFKLSPRNLDENELNMSVKLARDDDQPTSSPASFEDRGRKSKLRKILVPILVFVLLKAMTLIPLAIGVLGLKAWNALQLSFISFLVSISLAIFQLVKKVAAESGQIAAHIPFETSHYAAARNFIFDAGINGNNVAIDNRVDQVVDNTPAQNMAYRGYVKEES